MLLDSISAYRFVYLLFFPCEYLYLQFINCDHYIVLMFYCLISLVKLASTLEMIRALSMYYIRHTGKIFRIRFKDHLLNNKNINRTNSNISEQIINNGYSYGQGYM